MRSTCKWCEWKNIASGNECCWGKEAFCKLEHDCICYGYECCDNPKKEEVIHE